ncbi:MAG: NDP-sugar synthase [Chloroflexi bacterium]|nr:NDP-sugar synthase [Chloroflexota bacterium]
MKAIILVGGEGTRLRPLTYSVVKPMVPVVNRPFIEHVILKLAAHGINDIVLAMGYKPDSIFAYFKDGAGAGIKLSYSLEEKPLGTAGAVKNAGGHVEDTFFVLNGDTFSDIDYTEMLAFHRRNRALATIALSYVDDPTRFGVVETDKSGRVKAFIEKPTRDRVTSNWINAGVYILQPSVLGCIPDNQFFMFEKGVFPPLLERGERVFGYAVKSYWIDMGRPSQYHQLNCDVLRGLCSSPLYSVKDITIEQRCSVHPSARITGPAIINNGCNIAEDAVIIGPAVIGSNCIIGKGAVIENSVLWDDIIVGAGASITGSIIASGAKIEENARLEDLTVNQDAPSDPITKKI